MGKLTFEQRLRGTGSPVGAREACPTEGALDPNGGACLAHHWATRSPADGGASTAKCKGSPRRASRLLGSRPPFIYVSWGPRTV